MIYNFFKNYLKHYKGISQNGWVILTANLINKTGSATALFLSIYLHIHLHYSLMVSGILIGSYGAGCILGSFLGGVLSDKVKPVFILMLSLLISAIFFITLTITTKYYLLLGLLFLLGLSVSMGQPAISLSLNTYLNKEDRLRAFSIYRTTNNIGVSITGIIGGILATHHFNYLFYLDGISSFLAATILFFSLGKTGFKSTPQNKALSTTSFKTVLLDKFFMLIWITMIFALLVFIQITSTYPIYLHQNYQLSTKSIGAIFALNGILVAFMQVPITNQFSKFNLFYVAITGIMLIGIGLGILPYGSTLLIAILSCIAWTIGEMLFFPTTMTLVLNHIDSSCKGKYMSVYDVAITTSKLFFPFLGTLCYQKIGGNMLWLFCLISSMIGSAILYYLKSVLYPL